MTISIAGRKVGDGEPALVIAEAGVNHNGQAELARRLVIQAKRAAADCVKFQTFRAERVVTKNAPKADYQLQGTSPAESQFEMLKSLELDRAVYRELVGLCKKEGILFLSTPYDEEDADFLETLGVEAYKLASIHVVEHRFLSHVARKGKPLILSTGMSTLEEVSRAVRVLRDAGNKDFVLLQCTTDYPSSADEANLRAMVTMRDSLGVLTGYSDHTQSFTAATVAAALGACVFERHFTLDRSLPGPDQACSLDPRGFSEYARTIREAERALGSSEKEPTAREKKNAIGMRRSIVAAKAILAGQTITPKDILMKRPAGGLLGDRSEEVLGRKALKKIKKDQRITPDLLQ
ncbi:MAG: N-acetylneuraminate synthase family protein [Candidatus Omnitrophica bacterium]|nr:N-acetylneuraminate synthase family protein [Candidatus Omnitrophota bacterium]